MKKIAMILNGIVDNIAVYDGESAWNPGPQYTLVECPPNVDLGFNYDANTGLFSSPEES